MTLKTFKSVVKQVFKASFWVFVWILITTAFSPKSRNKIFERDNWTCQGCGKRGGYLQASHFNHRRSYQYYDHPANGETLCINCHIKFHRRYVGDAQSIGLTENGNEMAICLLYEMLEEKY